MDTNEILQFGALGVLLLLGQAAIAKFFEYLKSRKENGQNDTKVNTENAIVAALNKIGDNHLNHVEMAVKDGDQKIVEKLSDMQIKTLESNKEIVTVLTEIKERLPKP